MKPCVFFDRDGIVNVPPPPEDRYVLDWSRFTLIPDFVECLRLVKQRGYEAVIITNQRGVGIGRMTQEDLDEIHDRLEEALGEEELHLLDIIACTDEDDSSPRRKPNPGMLYEAAEKHHLDLKQSWMIGDSERDVVAGKRADCQTVLVGHKDRETCADFRVDGMTELYAFLEAHA